MTPGSALVPATAAVVPTPVSVAALTVTFTTQLLAQVVEVAGFCVVPGENLVGIGLGNDFSLNQSSKPGFSGVFV